MRRKKDPTEDSLDRETQIADMNVEGMPWYAGDNSPRTLRARKKELKASGNNQSDTNSPPLSNKESMHLIANAIVAAMVVALIFIGAAFLFILFCEYVWLR